MDPLKLLSEESPAELLSGLGGKASNLHRLSQRNIPVPPWLCIPASAFEKIHGQIGPSVQALLAAVDFSSQASLNAASDSIKALWNQSELPVGFAEEVLRSVSTRFSKDTLFAVRSSALGEDSEANSFAGQLDTFLFVTQDQLIQKIRECWASAFSPRILSYLNTKGENPAITKVAVIIQEMVNSSKSGVMFQAHPQTGNLDEVVIVAGYGVGEGIVSDQVETDTFILNKTNRNLISREIQSKESKIAFDTESRFGTVKLGVTPSLQNLPVLSDVELDELLALGATIHQIYQTPQDIEWAFNEQGRLFITQSRPITTLNLQTPPPSQKLIFDNSNIVESYPGVTAPLTLSFIKEAYSQIFSDALLILGFSNPKIQTIQSSLDHMLGYYQGRVYYNLSNWYRIF